MERRENGARTPGHALSITARPRAPPSSGLRGQSLTIPTLTSCSAQVGNVPKGRMSTFLLKECGSSQASSTFCALNSRQDQTGWHSPFPWDLWHLPTSPDNAPAHPSDLSTLSKVTWTILLQHCSMRWDFPAFPAELLAHSGALKGNPTALESGRTSF